MNTHVFWMNTIFFLIYLNYGFKMEQFKTLTFLGKRDLFR